MLVFGVPLWVVALGLLFVGIVSGLIALAVEYGRKTAVSAKPPDAHKVITAINPGVPVVNTVFEVSNTAVIPTVPQPSDDEAP